MRGLKWRDTERAGSGKGWGRKCRKEEERRARGLFYRIIHHLFSHLLLIHFILNIFFLSSLNFRVESQRSSMIQIFFFSFLFFRRAAFRNNEWMSHTSNLHLINCLHVISVTPEDPYSVQYFLGLHIRSDLIGCFNCIFWHSHWWFITIMLPMWHFSCGGNYSVLGNFIF